MDWKSSCRARLPEHLDDHGDLAPPWEEFPTYEHLSLGWRMGSGEDWLGLWHVFVEDLPADPGVRLAYLKRHRPAPLCWAPSVRGVLEADASDGEVTREVVLELLEQGLVEVDAAYGTWRASQVRPRFPWHFAETPTLGARIHTREFWFSSRQMAELSDEERQGVAVPASWRSCAGALASRAADPLDLRRGLEALALMLCAGTVQAPWEVQASLEDFADTFDDSMGYVDAFRLWAMSAFDARVELEAYLDAHPAPASWGPWISEELAEGLA